MLQTGKADTNGSEFQGICFDSFNGWESAHVENFITGNGGKFGILINIGKVIRKFLAQTLLTG